MTQILSILLASVLALFSSPYGLLQDILFFLPAIILMSIYATRQKFTFHSTMIYLAVFLLILLKAFTQEAWEARLIMGLFAALVVWIYHNRTVVLVMGIQL